MEKWIFDSVNARVVTENDGHIFYTDNLTCPDSVVEEVVRLHNENTNELPELGSEGIIDSYLLDEGQCTQEDREIITECIFTHNMSLDS